MNIQDSKIGIRIVMRDLLVGNIGNGKMRFSKNVDMNVVFANQKNYWAPTILSLGKMILKKGLTWRTVWSSARAVMGDWKDSRKARSRGIKNWNTHKIDSTISACLGGIYRYE